MFGFCCFTVSSRCLSNKHRHWSKGPRLEGMNNLATREAHPPFAKKVPQPRGVLYFFVFFCFVIVFPRQLTGPKESSGGGGKPPKKFPFKNEVTGPPPQNLLLAPRGEAKNSVEQTKKKPPSNCGKSGGPCLRQITTWRNLTTPIFGSRKPVVYILFGKRRSPTPWYPTAKTCHSPPFNKLGNLFGARVFFWLDFAQVFGDVHMSQIRVKRPFLTGKKRVKRNGFFVNKTKGQRRFCVFPFVGWKTKRERHDWGLCFFFLFFVSVFLSK